MTFELTQAHKLALDISSCDEVCKAINDKTHPCSKVVNWQSMQWNPPVLEIGGSKMHRPEPWTGDLQVAPMMFLSSNPSFDANENFPSWDQEKWPEQEIAKFGAERFTSDFSRSHGATESSIVSEQDRTIGLEGQISGRVKHWSWVRQFASVVYGKSISDTSAISDYVMTELVHCKSPHEEGVIEALGKCKEKWFDKIMELSPAKLIFVAGVKAGADFADLYSNAIPSDWGSWSNSKTGKGQGSWPLQKSNLEEMSRSEKWSLDTQMLNSVDVEIAGITRTIVYIARPGGGGGLCAPWVHPDLIHPDLIRYWQSKLI